MFDESGESGCPFMFVFGADRGSVPFMNEIFYKKNLPVLEFVDRSAGVEHT